MNIFSIVMIFISVAFVSIYFYFISKEDGREKERHLASLKVQQKQLEAWATIEKAAAAIRNEHTWEPYKEENSNVQEK